MNVENFEPTGNNVMLKAETIKTKGIVLLDETSQAKDMLRFTVVKTGPSLVDDRIKAGAVVWLRPHSAMSFYHEDKKKKFYILPESDVIGVSNE